jgi:cysteine desulfurase/selenocysteine lyase
MSDFEMLTRHLEAEFEKKCEEHSVFIHKQPAPGVVVVYMFASSQPASQCPAVVAAPRGVRRSLRSSSSSSRSSGLLTTFKLNKRTRKRSFNNNAVGDDAGTPGLDESTVLRVRGDTPGIAAAGTGGIAHFNAAGSSLPPREVLDAQVDYLNLESLVGGYEATELRADALQRPYDALAALLGCTASEIAITQSATSAWQMAFSSFTFQPGDRILTARAEYASNYIAYMQVAARTGAVIETIPSDAAGQLDVAALERMLLSDDSDHEGADEGAVPSSKGAVRLISITHVPTSGGLVNPAAAVGALAKKYKVPYLLDACQSVGQMPVDVDAIGCDFLAATGRKYLRGPRGIGFLYARSSLVESEGLEPAFLDLYGARWDAAGHYQPFPGARRFEQYEVSFAAKVGLGVAVDYALALGVSAAWERTRHLAGALRTGLERLDGVTVRDVGEVRCGIVSFSVDGVGAGQVREALREREVNVWTSKVCNNTRLEWEERAGGGMPDEIVRSSVHYYNTVEEIARLVDAVESCTCSYPPDESGEWYPIDQTFVSGK